MKQFFKDLISAPLSVRLSVLCVGVFCLVLAGLVLLLSAMFIHEMWKVSPLIAIVGVFLVLAVISLPYTLNKFDDWNFERKNR